LIKKFETAEEFIKWINITPVTEIRELLEKYRILSKQVHSKVITNRDPRTLMLRQVSDLLGTKYQTSSRKYKNLNITQLQYVYDQLIKGGRSVEEVYREAIKM
jgi:hypothetical protein